MSRKSFALALAALLLALGSSVMLVTHHFSGVSLPGCGAVSACAQLAASRWGSFLGVPVSVIGLAYFTAILAASVAVRSWRVPVATCRGVAGLLFAGAAVSLFFLAIMLIEGKWCGYCLVTHLANLVFTATVLGAAVASNRGISSRVEPASEATTTTGSERVSGSEPPLETDPTPRTVRRWMIVFAGVFLLGLVGLGVANRSRVERIAGKERQLADSSTARVIAIDEAASGMTEPPENGGFTGRHPRGPELAAARLVVFLDYECPDCRRLESELELLVEETELVSLTLRHFPMCSECNPSINYEWFHPNACRAARVAEAATVLGGEAGFFKAHRWLIEQEGTFEPEALSDLASRLRVTPQTLTETMGSPEVSRRVDQDIREAISLGVESTPFIFLNGTEIRGAAGDGIGPGTRSDPGRARRCRACRDRLGPHVDPRRPPFPQRSRHRRAGRDAPRCPDRVMMPQPVTPPV